MKRSRGRLDKKAAEQQDAALAAVLAELEAEHGTPQVMPTSCPADASNKSSRPSSGVTTSKKRETAFDAPPGYCYDEKTGFWFNRSDNLYFERTPTRDLYCNASTGACGLPSLEVLEPSLSFDSPDGCDPAGAASVTVVWGRCEVWGRGPVAWAGNSPNLSPKRPRKCRHPYLLPPAPTWFPP